MAWCQHCPASLSHSISKTFIGPQLTDIPHFPELQLKDSVASAVQEPKSFAAVCLAIAIFCRDKEPDTPSGAATCVGQLGQTHAKETQGPPLSAPLRDPLPLPPQAVDVP